MRKILCIIVAMLCTLGAYGQQVGHDITLRDPMIEVLEEELEITFELKASNMNLRTDEMIMLEFAIEDSERRLVLPVVVYCGNYRYHYEQRRRLLSEDNTLSAYHIYKGIKPKLDYELTYTFRVPRQEWMEHAVLSRCEYYHVCTGEILVDSGLVTTRIDPTPVPTPEPEPVAPVETEPAVWIPDAALFPSLVNFLQPEVEDVKARAALIQLRIGFPVNGTDVLPDFDNNRRELARADSLIAIVNGNKLIDVRSIGIQGYASPEGAYTHNKRLAEGRSASFKRYLTMTYPGDRNIQNAVTTSVPEDWEGVRQLIQQMDIPSKQYILDIVNDPAIDPEAKSRALLRVPWWRENRSFIEGTLYASLRRIELRIDYVVENLSDSQARDLLFTDPTMLSLDEIYRVALFYNPDSSQYLEVYETAAKMFPRDIIANNNAAAALLRQGAADKARPYLDKLGDSPVSYINWGTYYYATGDAERAKEYFEKAKAAGYAQGADNLEKIK